MTRQAAPLTTALTEAQRADARVWMQAARAGTIERHPYLDTALSSMLLVERIGLGSVSVDARWRLYYDPARALHLQQEHGIEALASDWVHEVMHVLRDHLSRWDEMRQDPDRHAVFNIAGDAHVNADVADLGLPILDTDITFERLPADARCTRTMVTEEIYTRLLDHVTVIEADCGSGTGGSQRPWELTIGDGVDDGSPDNGQAVIIREETARSVRAAQDAGRLPAGLLAWADAFMDPVVNWRAELRSVVSRRLGQAAGVTDYSFTRLARRRVPGYTLPGMISPSTPRVAAVVDTSGSMTPDDLAQCIGDLLSLSRAVCGDGTAITVITCDSVVHDVVTVRRPAEVRGLKLKGGGGTNMAAGIKACAGLRPVPEVVVILTDGGTPWPDSAPPALAGARFVALITCPQWAHAVPGWMHAITVT